MAASISNASLVLARAYATHRCGRRIASDLGAVAFTVGTAGVVFFAAVGSVSGAWKLLVALPTGALLAFTLWSGYVALTRRCYWVRVGSDLSFEFRALLRRTRVQATEVLALERSSASLFWYSGDEPSGPDNTKVVFADGSVIVVQPLDGFEELRALLVPS